MSQPRTAYAERLRRLSDAFRAGYPSCPPLRHAVLTGIGPGVTFAGEEWAWLLQGEGHPWKWGILPDFESQDDQRWAAWRDCWFTDRKDTDLTGAWKAFLDLAGEAARCRYGFLRLGPADPEGTSFVGQEWVAALHRLAWSSDDPVLKAPRYRFHRTKDADTTIRVDYCDAMAADLEMTAPPPPGGPWTGWDKLPAPLAFPHSFLSVLGPDVFQASALAINSILARDDPTGQQTTPPVAEPPPPTIWFHGGKSYSADGKQPRNVSNEQHNALTAFLDKDQAQDTRTLERAGVSSVSKVMGKLNKRFPGAVRKPRFKGDGYYIRVRTLTPTG
jgi:hypothetical protein